MCRCIASCSPCSSAAALVGSQACTEELVQRAGSMEAVRPAAAAAACAATPSQIAFYFSTSRRCTKLQFAGGADFSPSTRVRASSLEWSASLSSGDGASWIGKFGFCNCKNGPRRRLLHHEARWVCCDNNGGLVGLEERVLEGGGDAAAAGGKKRSQQQQLYTVVMKFGGSSVASADRMREVADLILSFRDEIPIIVMSAMGKTTNNLLKAGEAAISCEVAECCSIVEFNLIKDLHLRTADQLGIDRSIIAGLLEELESLLTRIGSDRELSDCTKDELVSFGERLSTRIFSAYLNKIGRHSQQYDAFDLGVITTDEFTNAEIVETTYPTVLRRLQEESERCKKFARGPTIPVVTGFLGKGMSTGLVTTLGRGGSDLTATAIGKALGLREIQVWKDVDGVLTCNPSIYGKALPVPFLTFEEASELAYFGAQVLHPESMRPAEAANIPVRVKNSYNPQSPGTLITRNRDMSQSNITSIVLKQNVTMVDIQSTRMLGRVGFLAKVFTTFEKLGISVDVLATSEVSISLTLDPSKLWSRELIQQELDKMKTELQSIGAVVNLVKRRSIISLICNVKRSSLILEKVFEVFNKNNVNVQMISQGASKVNISMVVDDAEAESLVIQLHKVFFPELESDGNKVIVKGRACQPL